jgi:plastocyanin
MRRPVVFSALLALGLSCGGAPSQSAATAPTSTAAAPGTTAPAATSTPAPTPTSAPTAATALIEMGDHFFAPAQLTVKVGTTVTWRSVGQSTHDLAARDGSFKDPGMSFGQTLSYTFTRAGSFPYVCMQHEGDGMVGVVTVID